MLCKKPYMVGALSCGCGQCLPCRINKRRLWSHRLILESVKHAGSCFVTLTYDDMHLPYGGSLDPTHPKNWLKRLRKEISPQKIRYFLVGEYGEEKSRPHYHAAVFGLDPVTAGGLNGISGSINRCWSDRSGPLGYTYVGDLTPQSASYIAGYVTKKMTNKNDSRLNGRYPEFARMSLKPGIGADAMQDVAKALETSVGLDHIVDYGIPSALRHQNHNLPIGRYLKSKLREALGYGRKPSDDEKLISSQKMCELQMAARAEAKTAGKNLNEYIMDKWKQQMLQLETKFKIYSQKGAL